MLMSIVQEHVFQDLADSWRALLKSSLSQMSFGRLSQASVSMRELQGRINNSDLRQSAP